MSEKSARITHNLRKISKIWRKVWDLAEQPLSKMWEEPALIMVTRITVRALIITLFQLFKIYRILIMQQLKVQNHNRFNRINLHNRIYISSSSIICKCLRTHQILSNHFIITVNKIVGILHTNLLILKMGKLRWRVTEAAVLKDGEHWIM